MIEIQENVALKHRPGVCGSVVDAVYTVVAVAGQIVANDETPWRSIVKLGYVPIVEDGIVCDRNIFAVGDLEEIARAVIFSATVNAEKQVVLDPQVFERLARVCVVLSQDINAVGRPIDNVIANYDILDRRKRSCSVLIADRDAKGWPGPIVFKIISCELDAFCIF